MNIFRGQSIVLAGHRKNLTPIAVIRVDKRQKGGQLAVAAEHPDEPPAQDVLGAGQRFRFDGLRLQARQQLVDRFAVLFDSVVLIGNR